MYNDSVTGKLINVTPPLSKPEFLVYFMIYLF